MHLAVTGSRGLIGSALVPFLITRGHRVTRLVRGPAAVTGDVSWSPAEGITDVPRLQDLDGVIHLAGENIASARWTEVRKAGIRRSRVEGTQRLCESLGCLARPPRVLVSASAIGFYGDRGDETLSEDSPPGRGFLAEVCREWEAATEPAARLGVRVVPLRFGMILSPTGGALKQMLLPFRLGAGGKIGSGAQFMSWIALDDVLGVILHALLTESLHEPVNVVAPAPVTNAEFTRTLARVLSRPALAPLPAFAVRLAFGELADALLLASARVVPAKLQVSGYRFQFPQLEGALRHLLTRKH
jgi:uncharacterized protein